MLPLTIDELFALAAKLVRYRNDRIREMDEAVDIDESAEDIKGREDALCTVDRMLDILLNDCAFYAKL